MPAQRAPGSVLNLSGLWWPLVEGGRATKTLGALAPEMKLLILHLLWYKRRD